MAVVPSTSTRQAKYQDKSSFANYMNVEAQDGLELIERHEPELMIGEDSGVSEMENDKAILVRMLIEVGARLRP